MTTLKITMILITIIMYHIIQLASLQVSHFIKRVITSKVFKIILVRSHASNSQPGLLLSPAIILSCPTCYTNYLEKHTLLPTSNVQLFQLFHLWHTLPGFSFNTALRPSQKAASLIRAFLLNAFFMSGSPPLAEACSIL